MGNLTINNNLSISLLNYQRDPEGKCFGHNPVLSHLTSQAAKQGPRLVYQLKVGPRRWLQGFDQTKNRDVTSNHYGNNRYSEGYAGIKSY